MKKILLTSTVVLLTLLFLQFGRSIYIPLLNKVKSKETVETIVEKIGASATRRLEANLSKAEFKELPEEIVLVAFKEEQILEVYGIKNHQIKFLKEYPFTAYSGKLGPKLKEGDQQIPEGIYYVEYLNPNSSYYLSIKVSYPNEFDREKSNLSSVAKMGGDIFIHGKAATVGCIPVGDEAIEEVFLLAQNALHKVVKIIISPRDFRVNHVFPKIEAIDWEEELYGIIEQELSAIPLK